jgi:UDP-N-acetylenolpyruvoylglucosamine reductase
MVESCEGSSSVVNSPVSAGEAQIAEGNKIQEKFDTEGKAFEMHNNTRDFVARSSGISKRVHQLCVIIMEVEEESNHEGNEGVDKQVDKVREHKKKEKDKIHVSAGEWRIIMSAISHGTEVPKGSRREVLMGYQYALH